MTEQWVQPDLIMKFPISLIYPIMKFPITLSPNGFSSCIGPKTTVRFDDSLDRFTEFRKAIILTSYYSERIQVSEEKRCLSEGQEKADDKLLVVLSVLMCFWCFDICVFLTLERWPLPGLASL